MIKVVIGGLLSFLSFQSWGNPAHLNCYADKDNTEGAPIPLIIDLGKKTASFGRTHLVRLVIWMRVIFTGRFFIM